MFVRRETSVFFFQLVRSYVPTLDETILLPTFRLKFYEIRVLIFCLWAAFIMNFWTQSSSNQTLFCTEEWPGRIPIGTGTPEMPSTWMGEGMCSSRPRTGRGSRTFFGTDPERIYWNLAAASNLAPLDWGTYSQPPGHSERIQKHDRKWGTKQGRRNEVSETDNSSLLTSHSPPARWVGDLDSVPGLFRRGRVFSGTQFSLFMFFEVGPGEWDKMSMIFWDTRKVPNGIVLLCLRCLSCRPLKGSISETVIRRKS